MDSISASKLQASSKPSESSSKCHRYRHHRHPHNGRFTSEEKATRRTTNRITAVGALSGAAVGALLIGGGLGAVIGGVTVGLVTRGAVLSKQDRREPAKIY